MNHKIITIARQFGSGGHEIAQRTAELLGIPLYDRNLVEMAAEKMGQSPPHVAKVDDAALSVGNYLYVNGMVSATGFSGSVMANVYFSDGTTDQITVDEVRNSSNTEIPVTVPNSSDEARQGSDTAASGSVAADDSHDYDGWYSYTVSDGEYTLRRAESGVGFGTSAVIRYGAGLDVTGGETVRFLYDDTTNTNKSDAVSGNDNTIFLVDDGSDVSVYTGINNLPDISVKSNVGSSNNRVYVSYMMDKDSTTSHIASLVYIYADEDMANIDVASTDDVLYVLNRSSRMIDRVNGDAIEVWNVVLNGEVTTIEAKEGEFTAYSMYYRVGQDSDGYYEGDLFTQGVGSSGRRAGAMSIASGHQIDYSAGTLDLGSAVYTVNNNTQIVLVLKDASNASATGTKDRTNNLGARTTDGGVIVMRDDNAKHEVYTVSGQTLENYVRDRNVDGEFYGITSDNDSDLLEVLYVVIEDVSLLSGESRVSGT